MSLERYMLSARIAHAVTMLASERALDLYQLRSEELAKMIVDALDRFLESPDFRNERRCIGLLPDGLVFGRLALEVIDRFAAAVEREAAGS